MEVAWQLQLSSIAFLKERLKSSSKATLPKLLILLLLHCAKRAFRFAFLTFYILSYMVLNILSLPHVFIKLAINPQMNPQIPYLLPGEYFIGKRL